MSLSAPAGFHGQLLYVRKDLLSDYAAGRQLVWFCWGERQMSGPWREELEWLVAARRSNSDVWKQVRILSLD